MPSLRSPESSMAITPRASGARAGSLTSNESRRRWTSSASPVDCDKKYCNRCAAACCAPTTGSDLSCSGLVTTPAERGQQGLGFSGDAWLGGYLLSADGDG